MTLLRSEVQSNDGTQVSVWTSGCGRPLLIVHGAAGTHHTWEMMREHLDPYLTVTIMDRRATSGDPSSRLEMTREFEDVAAVARSLSGDLAVLGHSSGALCALGAAPLIPNLRHLLLAQYLPREMAAHLAWTFDPPTYSGVSARTVYLVGSETPEENLELRGFIKLLEKALPSFAVREIPQQGHFANFFAPQLLAAIILESIQT